MTYIDGFVIPVPHANKEKFIAYGHRADDVFVQHGATRIFECWQDDLPAGMKSEFAEGVKAAAEEAIAFSWIEWPDKAARISGMAVLDEVMKADPHFDQTANPLPFDGERLLWGCFETLVERGNPAITPYVKGFVFPALAARKQDYFSAAERAWERLRLCGALRLIAAWEDDLPRGGPTDFFRMAKIEPAEKVAFAFVEWSSREVCEAAPCGVQDVFSDPSLFDRARLISGGFTPVVEAIRQQA